MIKVCVMGPESTGKSSLTKHLADHYETDFAPEFAASYLEKYKEVTELVMEDFVAIARGQGGMNEEVSRIAERIVFFDTDPVMAKIWAHTLIGKSSPILDDLAKASDVDLYLLTDIDAAYNNSVMGIKTIRWTARHRNRVDFLRDCRRILTTLGKEYRMIRGDGEKRRLCAVSAIHDHANKRNIKLHEVYACS